MALVLRATAGLLDALCAVARPTVPQQRGGDAFFCRDVLLYPLHHSSLVGTFLLLHNALSQPTRYSVLAALLYCDSVSGASTLVGDGRVISTASTRN